MIKSVGAMIQQLEGLLGTPDVTQWESNFIASVVSRTNNGKHTVNLTEKQLDTIESIWQKNFAG